MKTNIVFTDSGLGGLSIMTDFVKRLQEKEIPGDFDITFFNALPCDGVGYNRRTDTQEKTDIFNRALFSIREKQNPDIIAIACNTLSALYPKTQFSKKPQTNVIEIIAVGRKILTYFRQENSELPVFILATPTTIKANAYNSIIGNSYTIAAGNLASEIELDINSMDVKKTVEKVFEEIRILDTKTKDIVLFLGCTHYSYILDLWNKMALDYGYNVVKVLDPAEFFNDHLSKFPW